MSLLPDVRLLGAPQQILNPKIKTDFPKGKSVNHVLTIYKQLELAKYLFIKRVARTRRSADWAIRH